MCIRDRSYRKPNSSLKSLFISLFQPHNDLFNIWSHLLGSFYFIYLLCYIAINKQDDNFILSKNLEYSNINLKNPHDKLKSTAFMIYLGCGAFVMFCSALYHTFRPKSEKIYTFLKSMDIAGICIFNFGSVVSGNYYYNYCDRPVEFIYFFLSFIFSLFAFVSVIIEENFQKIILLSQETTLILMVAVNFLSLIHIFIMGILSSEFNDLMPFNHSISLIVLSLSLIHI